MIKLKKLRFLFLSVIFFSVVSLSHGVDTELSRAIMSSLTQSIGTFVNDYGRVQGVYGTTAYFDGRSSVGEFPSFRLDFSIGAILNYNAFGFLSKVNAFGWTYDDMKESLGGVYTGGLKFFDDNFFPLPMTGIKLEIGLPYNLSAGVLFSILPVSPILDLVRSNIGGTSGVLSYFNTMMFWNVGGNVRYTLLRDSKFTPDISVNIGFIYSDSTFQLQGISAGSIQLDDDSNVDASFGFNSRFQSSIIFLEGAISKKFGAFRPFLNFKLVQTIVYSNSEFFIQLDLSDASQSAKDTYGNGRLSANNLKDGVGQILPFTDFVITTGFDLVLGIFNMGIQGGYGAVSKRGTVTLSFGFNPDRKTFIDKQTFKKK